ncbi:MAG: AraC family transcriptional regulator [Opitutaceae bacterium]|jgi:AraC-like DNA-binding protein|nr:AraC family transcriptional regulator [Opitutaceae bacterium]
MPASDRKKVLAALAAWLKSPSTRPVVRILEGKKPESTQRLYFKEVPRLVLALDGTGRYITIEHGHEMMFDLAPGQVLYLAPCTWSCPLPRMPYRSLAITFRSDSTRVTIHSRQALPKNGTIPWRYLAEWQTSASLGARGEHLLRLFEDSTPPRLGGRMYNMIAEMLVSEVAGLVGDAPELGRSHDTILWHSLCDYISAHWSDPLLSREQAAAFFNRHPNHISRFFHKHTRQNFRAYVNEIRLKRSVQFLADMRYNVTDVSNLCGFTDLQYFIRCFRKRFGLTPGEYRKQRQ